jgi:hypothetical protein
MNTETKVAKEFSRIVTEWLGKETMLKVIRENQEHVGTMYEDCCATGNYCDSNMAMLEAFENTLGREFQVSYGINGEENLETLKAHDADCELWNTAWDMAKKNRYWIGKE